VKFWDASAIVPLLIDEPPRESLLNLLERDPLVLVWWGTPVEFVSAVARREREQSLTIAEAAAAIERMRALVGEWQEVLPSEPVRTMAQRLLRLHPLRAADSLQLAAAIIASEQDPTSLDFVSLDERLNAAAGREGFRLFSAEPS